MSPPSKERVDEVKSELYAIINAPVGTPAMVEIDQEMTPILTELLTLGHDCQQHPTVRQLFNWLVHEERTVTEFNYVVGTLGYYVSEVMDEHFYEYKHQNNLGNPNYLAVAAVEALAVKCPVLEGPWEHAGWFVAHLLTFGEYFDIPSACLSSWIIKVIGDVNTCPNVYLRFDLMCSLLQIVEIDMHNKTQVTETMMSACSSLDFHHLSSGYYGKFSEHNYHTFYEIFVKVADHGTLLQFGDTLAKKLRDQNMVQLSSTLHDNSYQCSLNNKNYTEPWELQSLIAILNTTAAHAGAERRVLEGDGIGTNETIDEVLIVFNVLLYNFGYCFKLPQLTCPAATFVMEVLEFIFLSTKIHDNPDRDYWSDVTLAETLIKELLTNNGSITIAKSPIQCELISRYSQRLRKLGSQFTNLDIYFTIYSLLHHT